jgi:hypothetical protein
VDHLLWRRPITTPPRRLASVEQEAPGAAGDIVALEAMGHSRPVGAIAVTILLREQGERSLGIAGILAVAIPATAA